MRYVLNSAVISRPGNYAYRLITELEAEAWLKQGRFVGRVGSREVVRFLGDRFNVLCPLSREPIAMQPGDEALIVRLLYRPPPPAAQDPRAEGWEIGLLKRTA